MILGISTSLGKLNLVIAEGQEILLASSSDISLKNDASLDKLLLKGLQEANVSIQQITSIIVDIGPGGTSSVRTGVAFANGLAYSLKIPVIPVSSFELIGADLWDTHQQNVLCIIKSIKTNIFAGLYDGSTITTYYGDREKLAATISKENKELVLAGFARSNDILVENMPQTQVNIVDYERVNPLAMIKYYEKFVHRAMRFPQLPTPINETQVDITISND